MVSKMNKKFIITTVILLSLTWMFLDDLVEDWGQIESAPERLETFFNEDLWPPDWSVLEAEEWADGTLHKPDGELCTEDYEFFCSKAWTGMVITIKMAFISTLIGFMISVPIASLAASNLAPLPIAIPARVILAGLRSLPSIIWALLFAIALGFGPLPGILAMTLYTIGYLGKLQYEAIEGIANAPLESAMAMGLTHSERLVHVVIPESSNDLLSQLMFMFEYNVRHGTVLGLVGAGGIGMYIDNYINPPFAYDKAFALLIVVFVVVVIIDLISMFVRSYVIEDGDVKRPKWWTVLLPAGIAADYYKKFRAKDSDESE
ncbi:MAG: phosphonate ABC transporter, permease protein PhnE [Euryarchaeota archaeon]|nr:phosphonate ABC transporter, permease protein PhnE [Euryarchaeota archaeon]